jgi:hypothetical protein
MLPDSQRDVNQNLSHRGVRFAIKRVSHPDVAPEYRWTIYPRPGPEEATQNGFTDGPRAFLRAYKAAQSAINLWLTEHPAGDAMG